MSWKELNSKFQTKSNSCGWIHAYHSLIVQSNKKNGMYLYCGKVEYLLVLFFGTSIAPFINVGVRLRPTNKFHNQQ